MAKQQLLKRGNKRGKGRMTKDAPRAAALKGNNREIWAIDSETDPFKQGRVPRPFIWGAYNGTEYYEFDDYDPLVDFLSDRDCLVYAHNGGKFDYHYLLQRIPAWEEITVIAGRVAKFKIGSAEFRDSYNLLPMPLRAGGAKLEIDYAILEKGVRDLPQNKAIIKERLRTDCVYLYEMLEKFIADFGLHLTFPGASMHAWSKLSGIKKPETTVEFFETFQPYYFGGRVECFKSGESHDRLKLFDINSAYSFAMLSKHPWGENYHESRTLPNSRAAIERSFIDIVCESRGAMPSRDISGGIQFPNDGGTRLHTITGWEYLAALETGSLHGHEIRRVLHFSDAIDFCGYMDNFYQLKVKAKETGNVFAYECAKRFLCSLYGKFGSNPGEYLEYCLIPMRFLDLAEQEDGYLFATEIGDGRTNLGLCARPVAEHKRRYYNVAVAASITGYVRAYLWRAIKAARGVRYCDTDCILAEEFPGIATDPTKLGAWKHEADIAYSAIAGKKLYALQTVEGKWKTAAKGVQLTHDQIIRITRGETIVNDPLVPTYSLKQGIKFVKRKIRKTAA